MFLSNWLVFKIVLAAVTGLVDYPLAADVVLKYDDANKLYLDGNSVDYVSNVVLYKGETSYEIEGPNVIAGDEQKITASDAASSDQFGYSIVIDGDYAIIGSVNNNAAYIFKRDGSTGVWSEQTILIPTSDSQNSTSDKFGYSVSISGNYAIVGAPEYNHNANTNAGAAYIFVRSGTTWTQQQKLIASDLGGYDFFGRSVSISGEYAIIGAPLWDIGSSDTIEGVAYIFNRSGTNWSEQQKLIASDAGANDNFGSSVSISGNYAVVGAWPEDEGGSDAGAVYIFVRTGTSWSQQYKLIASDSQSNDNFGWSVDIDGDYVVIGAKNGDSNVIDSGSAYIFKRDGTTWSQQAKLTASDAAATDRFGWSVSISGNYAIVGAYNNDDNNASSSGSAYIFKRSGTNWSEQQKLLASDPAQDDEFGESVAISEDCVIVGAYRKNSYTGAAYIYPLKEVTNYYITQPGTYRADLQICGIDYKTNEVEVTGSIVPEKSFPSVSTKTYPSDDGTVSDNDYYGYVGLSGNGLVMVIVGIGDDDGTSDSGGFIVYEKINGVWTFTQQITGVGTGSGSFGNSDEGKSVQLDYDGTRVFIGAHADDHSYTNSGSVYIYRRIAQGNWTLEQRIDGGGASYRYGYNDVNNAGDKLIIGSYGYPGSGNTGRAWYYTRSGTTWSLQEQLAAPSTSAYGTSVGINSAGTRAIIGGYTHSSNTGRADIWNYSGSSWSLDTTFTGENASDKFGWNVDMSNDGNTVVVGAPIYSGGGEEGRAYIYTTSDGTNWSLTKTLSNQTANERFGFSVQISGDGNTVVIGAAKNDDGVTDGGRSYVYVKSGGSWPSTPTHTIIGTTANSNNGHTLGISDTGETIVSGAPFDDDKGTNQGAVYIFDKKEIAALTFDNYNKFSLTNTPTYASSKFAYYSNVYDIGTLTSDINIDKTGEYTSVTFDTSSNVAYFSNATVGTVLDAPATRAFFYGNFDDTFSDGDVTIAASNGRFYADMPETTTAFGTVSVTSSTSASTTYQVVVPTELTGTNVLIVGGGGGGGTGSGWPTGGGGGEVQNLTNQTISAGTYTIVVGNGGGQNSSGTNSSALGTTANSGTSSSNAGGTSGSGNGPGSNYGQYERGGGGGDASVGGNASDRTGGSGGDGSNVSWLDGTIYGEQVGGKAYFGGGGYSGDYTGSQTNGKGSGVPGTGGGGTLGGIGRSGMVAIYSSAGLGIKYLDFDTYNKLSIQNVTPTATTLKYGSNTYDLGTRTDVYIDKAGTYEAAITASDKFALVSNVVSGTIQPYTFMKNVQTIYGASGEYLGNSDGEGGGVICFNKDGTKLALSSFRASPRNIYVYTLTNGTYVLDSGMPLTNSNHFFGYSVSLNDDGTLLATNHFGGTNQQTGDTYVYQYSGGTWSLRATFGGGLYYTKASVLDGVGNRVLASASGTNTMKIYDWNGTTYAESQSFSGSGYFANGMDMTRDGLIVGGISKTTSDIVKVWQYSNGSWTQMGSDVSVGDMQPLFRLNRVGGTRFIVSNSIDDTAGTDYGIVKVYDYANGSWTNTKTFYGDSTGSYLGSAIDISDDGTVIIAGGSSDDTQDTNAGSFYEFKEINGVWETKKFYGYTAGSTLGSGTAMNSTGNVYAIGAGLDATNGSNSGKVLIYKPENVFSFDGYNKLSIQNITPTSTSLRLGSNTYDIGTVTDIYIDKAGTYEAEIKSTNTFALVSNVVNQIKLPDVVTVDWSTTSLSSITASNGDTLTTNVGGTWDVQTDSTMGKMVHIQTATTSRKFEIENSTQSLTSFVGTGDGVTISFYMKSVNPDYGSPKWFNDLFRVTGMSSGGPPNVYAQVSYDTGQTYSVTHNEWMYVQISYKWDGSNFVDYTFYIIDENGDQEVKVVKSDVTTNNGLQSSNKFWETNNKWFNMEVATFRGDINIDFYLTNFRFENKYRSESYWKGVPPSTTGYGSPSLDFDTYNKLSISGITPTSTTLKYGSNTYDIGTATDIYIANDGTYEIETKDANTFALVSNVTGTVTQVDAYDYSQAILTEQKLTASDRASQDQFGRSVSLSGDYAIVGALGKNSSTGAAYIYTRDPLTGQWGSEQKIVSSDAAIDDEFGYSVSISGDYAIVGARQEDPNNIGDAGAAYIYTRDPSTGQWGSEQKIVASDRATIDQFGESVSISGNYAIVGAHNKNSGTGAAYIYTYNGTSWGSEYKITASDAASSDLFGISVSISRDYAIVGAFVEDPNNIGNAGAAYIYTRDPSTGEWGSEQKIVASDGASNDQFGYSVSLSGDYAIVGVPYEDADGGSTDNYGAAYIYKRDPTSGVWGSEQKITASDKVSNDQFGISVSMSGDCAIVGAWRSDRGASDTKEGAAYIFKRNGTTWSEHAKLTASDRVSNDEFGGFVSISGRHAIIGARLEDSSGTDTREGAAYVYTAENLVPKLTHDGYKLVVKNITPTSTTLRLDSNTYDIGTATNIYVEDTGTYEIETKDTNTFALVSNTVTGTIKTIEPTLNGAWAGGHALTYDGKLYAWGENSNGELGVGDSTDKTVPTLCTGIPQGEVVSIWDQSTRGQSRWTKTRDGRIWVTGDHDTYSLPGSSGDFTTFTDVSAEFGDYTQTSNNVVWASGSGKATQVLMENGDVWSFGNDAGSLGVLGQGASPTSDRTPRKLNVSNITKIAYEGDLVLALDSSNVVWMWGRNEVGNNTPGWGPYNVPTNIMSTGTNSLTSLLATDSETVVDIESAYYSMYALTDKGTVYCTGDNTNGQLGQGNTTAKTSSDGWVKIEYFTSNAITVNRVYTGGEEYNYVFADTSDGWYCWGNNDFGELGLGDTNDKLSPVKFTGVSNIKKFALGSKCTYAVTEDGKYYAWGAGGNYRRGDNDTGNISYPKYIDTLPNILAPSFEFDGYDKVLAHMKPSAFVYEFYISVKLDGGSQNEWHSYGITTTSGTLTQSMLQIHPPLSAGELSDMFNGSYTSGTLVRIPDGYHEVGTKIMTLTTPFELADITFYVYRPYYQPGYKITCNGEIVLEETTNGGTASTPSPTSFTKTLSPITMSLTKYTKDTHTYDANQAQIVTVSDPGTYNAQLSQGSVFALTSANVSNTSTTGLYTWAFHHGNFDNAYGDGDILTARDNGRFYADTPSYTGDIGTITPGSSTTSNTTYTFTPASTLTANVLMVAGGGGGGGRYNCGGGGAGGLLYYANQSITTGAKTIVVGNGDVGGNGGGQSGFNGKDTTFTGLTTVVGGGGGSNQNDNGIAGGSGGGGGGGEESNYSQGGSGGSGTTNQGNAGGGGLNATTHGGGGGGGAGSAGTTATGSGTSGNGGTGKFFGKGSSYTNFGDEYGEGGWFAGGGGGGKRSGGSYGIPGRGGGGYGQPSSGYMAQGGSQHALPHTGGGGGGGGNTNTDAHSGYDAQNDTGVRGHGGNGGSGIVLIQTNIVLPNGANTAVVQVGNPRRRSLPPAVNYMGSEVNRFYIIDSASTPTHMLPTHWYVDPVGSSSNAVFTTQGSHSLQKRADGGTSNVWYATSNHYFAEYGSYMAQTADAVFMPVEQQSYDVLLSIGSNGDDDISFEMNADGTASLRSNVYTTSQFEIAGGSIVCFEAGKWHHIALTVDSGGNAVGYVNGYPVVSGTYTSVAAVGSRSGNMHFRCGVSDVTFRKFLTYEVNTYNFHMSPKQVLQRAAEVGLGPKLEYDGLNAINVVNTEPGSGTEITIYESNVNDTSNLYVVSCNESSYLLSNAGTYYAQIKGTDTFTITRPLTVTDDHFPLYQYPPVATGTLSNGNFTTAAGSGNQSYFTVSGAETGNGTYYSYSSVAAATSSDSSGVFTNGIGTNTITYTNTHNNYFRTSSATSNVDLVVILPSAKTIRKYVLYPTDTDAPTSPYEPGSSVDPTLSGGTNEDNLSRPKSWVLYGYTQSTGWVSLDTVTNQPPSIYGDVHSISSPASYDQYKLSISENNGSTSYIQLGEWQLWGDA